MKIAIIGSRDCEDLTIDRVLSQIPRNCSEIISGGAGGVDTLAEIAAKNLRVKLTVFKPDYESYGLGAPLIRNKKIAIYSDLVLAFWNGKSKGTANTIKWCIENQILFEIVNI